MFCSNAFQGRLRERHASAGTRMLRNAFGRLMQTLNSQSVRHDVDSPCCKIGHLIDYIEKPVRLGLVMRCPICGRMVLEVLHDRSTQQNRPARQAYRPMFHCKEQVNNVAQGQKLVTLQINFVIRDDRLDVMPGHAIH